MTSTELELRQPSLPAADEFSRMREIAQSVCKTEFVPVGLRGSPEKVLAAILAGREIGIGPMRALEHISVIDGKPNFSAELLLAKIREAGHSVTIVEHTDKQVTVKGVRRDTRDEHTVTWTLEDAAKAGIAGKHNWKHYPRTMLTWRAVTDLARFLFPDAIGGLLRYTADELGDAGRPPVILVDGETGEILDPEILDSDPPPDGGQEDAGADSAGDHGSEASVDASAQPEGGAAPDDQEGDGSLASNTPSPSSDLGRGGTNATEPDIPFGEESPWEEMMRLARECGWSKDRLLRSAVSAFSREIDSLQDLTADEVERVIQAAKKELGE